MWGVDLEVDGASVDSLVAASNPRRLGLDFPANVGKVKEAPVGLMEEFSKLGGLGRGRRFGRFRIVIVGGDVDELEDQRTTSDDARATGQEVPSDDILQNRRLSTTLRADDDLETTATISHQCPAWKRVERWLRFEEDQDRNPFRWC